MKRGFIFLSVLAAGATLLAGCSALETSPTTQLPGQTLSTGIVEVRVTDGPPGYEVQEVEMSVSSVEIHKTEDGDWIPLGILKDINPFILTDLQNGQEQTLALGHVDPGKYTQIRMGIEWVVIDYTKDGDPQDPANATLPSGELKFVRPFNVVEEETTVITFDFIVDESVHFTGATASEAPKVIFNPVIKLDIQQGGKTEETAEVEGDITGIEVVDENEGTVTIDPNGDPEVILNVTGQTEITLDGDSKTLSELETAFLALEEGQAPTVIAEYYAKNMNAKLIIASLEGQ